MNSSSFGNVIDVNRPIRENTKMQTTGIGTYHSFTIGATIVIDLAIIPQVPTDVFLLFAGNIRSSVNETYVVIMKPVMMPIFIVKIRIGINLSSKVSLEP